MIEGIEVSEVFRNTPRNFLPFNIRVIPLHKLPCVLHVLGDRFLGQDVFARGERLSDVIWLGEDREAE